MSTIKILYKTKKWDKEITSLSKVDAINLELTSIEKCINRFVNAKSLNSNRFPIKDSISFYFLLANEYFCLANSHYLIYGDTNKSIEYLYLYVISNIKAYDYFNNGVEITNLAIADEFKKQTFLEKLCFCSVAINRFDFFEKYCINNGCKIIKAIYHEDYEKAEELVSQLPDTSEIYENEKYKASYCYESIYMKALYQAILSKDEKEFNKALADRIKFIRKGYVMPVDVVSVTMIKFARKLGLDYNFDVIEIPKALLDDLSDAPFEEYQLPEV